MRYPVSYNASLNDETIKILSKAPSIRYLIENELHNGKLIHSFLTRMLIMEYLKINDIANAEDWLKTSNISVKEKQQLNEYLNSYKRLRLRKAE